MIGSESYDSCVSAGLRACGVDKLFLEIHDASFPAFFQEDSGRGTPYAQGAAKFLEQLAQLGFNGIQLGPQGLTAADNPSPYDGTLFSRNPLSLALSPLVQQGLLDEADIDSLLTRRPCSRDRVHYGFACTTQRRAIDLAYERFRADRAAFPALEQQLGELWRTHSQWLEPDALYSVLFRMHGHKSWRHWTSTNGDLHPDRDLFNPAPGAEAICAARRAALLEDHKEEIERYTFPQLLLQSQHRELREHCRALGIKLYADLQIGLADQDVWAHQGLLLNNYRMGAPPSRTNPMGQPWGFAVLDPAQYRSADGTPGPVLDFVRRRLRKIYSEYDGVRVDHPHGWVCPWVYRSDIEDPFYAVQHGARLFSSPNLPDHPALRAFSYVEEDQLDPEGAIYADYWVEHLTEEQVDAYAQVFSCLVSPEGASSQRYDLVCEVLSTLPLPLKQVLDRFGLGRFRVLQKVDPHNPTDVYRSENAEPIDWIMLGNHDTPTVWQLADEWVSSGTSRDRAEDLGHRLVPRNADREQWVSHHAGHRGALVHALFADLLISRACNIMVFFADLLGLKEQYNVPGTVNDSNWSLRVPPDYESRYLSLLVEDHALNLPYALSIALRAPGFELVPQQTLDLLDQEAQHLRDRGRSLEQPLPIR
jgi:4-alpha-glucanotransferase